MFSAQSIVTVAAVAVVLTAASPARAQSDPHEDLAACPGSAPEPAQTAAWYVAFCNRTGHDIVVEFHDNDCPINDWARRGDIYRRSLRRDESVTLPLCYADEPAQAASRKPGVPTLRIPGGKGVVTTWSVVGDCADRSDRLNLDARTFYDRGDYRSGIILLQYPAGASHCAADSSAAARPQGPPATAGHSAGSAAAAAVAAGAQSAAPAPSSANLPASSPAAANGQPAFTIVKDAKDILGRTVHVYATSAQGTPDYKCRLTLALNFTDGADFIDHPEADVAGGQDSALVLTKKYGKTVSKVALSSAKCSAH